MSLSPSIPDAPDPARRPERREGVDPEDIAIGSEEGTSEEGRGRRALRRPRGGASGANTQNVGTGLSA